MLTLCRVRLDTRSRAGVVSFEPSHEPSSSVFEQLSGLQLQAVPTLNPPPIQLRKSRLATAKQQHCVCGPELHAELALAWQELQTEAECVICLNEMGANGVAGVLMIPCGASRTLPSSLPCMLIRPDSPCVQGTCVSVKPAQAWSAPQQEAMGCAQCAGCS